MRKNMGFKEFILGKNKKLHEIYSVRRTKRNGDGEELIVTECKLILDGKQISFGLSRIQPEHYNAKVGKKLALAGAAKIFFKSQYNLTILDYAETENINI